MEPKSGHDAEAGCKGTLFEHKLSHSRCVSELQAVEKETMRWRMTERLHTEVLESWVVCRHPVEC